MKNESPPSGQAPSAKSRPSALLRATDDDTVDTFDVPAAILCATCGQADCPGCTAATDQDSGVIAIVPWERSGGVWQRLWATASATTQGAEAFFSVIPDGEINPAMRFAVLSELLAVASMAVLLIPLAAIALPGLTLNVVQDPSLRMRVLRWIALGVPALALWMVVAHVMWGAALDVGAGRAGGKPQRRRAVRFGLYACGWDLMAGPLGAIVTGLSKGSRAAVDLAELAMRVPGRASAAFLQGVYQLQPDALGRARRFGMWTAVAIAILSGAAVIGAIALAML